MTPKQFLQALITGLILSLPFIVEIIKGYYHE